MSQQIVKDYGIEALKMAASWPDADRATLVTLATVLAATGSDREGLAYFETLVASQPDQVLPLALAGYFQVRVGEDTPAGLARLDDAASRDLGPAQYYRGLALAGLPAEAGQAEQAITDLEFVLAVRDQFPTAMVRAAYDGLAKAYAAVGKDDLAAIAVASSGLGSAPVGVRLQFGGGWMNATDGYHFSSPRVLEVAPGVRVAQGYDFADFGFVNTENGLVAIDSGTAEGRARAALADAGLDARDVTHVILTHAHFDHVGGIGALVASRTLGTEAPNTGLANRPGANKSDRKVKVVAQAGFPLELERQRANVFPFRYFTGNGAGLGRNDAVGLAGQFSVDRLISGRTELSIDGTDFVLYPASGGETSDALMVYLPSSGVLFVGDVMMPYLGAPFFAEGSPTGLLDTLRLIVEVGPRLLVHGHTSLTELFTAGAVPGVLAALTELRDESLESISRGHTLTQLLKANVLPEVLREHPVAVGPYIAIRDHFVQRLYHQHSGYWQPDGEGLEPVDATDRATALDLLAGGNPERFAETARALLAQRDPGLALEVTTAGLAKHPDARQLAQLRQESLYRLMERHQLQDPFRFLIYAELAGVAIGPVASR